MNAILFFSWSVKSISSNSGIEVINSFVISIFFNILELKKNKENLNFSNQILLENKKVFNLFFLKETSTIYYLFGTLSFYYLYQSPREINWVLLPLFTVFAIDTSSYFIGSKFGKRKISFLEIISPNKTLIGFITAFFAIIGDLYSSAIKRNFGIKDYGNILPGHGGVLDRLDSVIISLVLIGLAKVFLSWKKYLF